MEIERQPDQPASIVEAFEELTPQAFAVWIRLMVTSEEELLGRKRIAKMLKYSLAASDNILNELKHKSYISFQRKKNPGGQVRVVIRRRAIISGRNNFVKLSFFSTGNSKE